MKRIAVRILIFLLLGAMLNVLVTWVIVVSIGEDESAVSEDQCRYRCEQIPTPLHTVFESWMVTRYEPHAGAIKVVSDHTRYSMGVLDNNSSRFIAYKIPGYVYLPPTAEMIPPFVSVPSHTLLPGWGSDSDIKELVPSWMPLEKWDKTKSYVQVYEASGWPMQSMRGGFTFRYDMDDTLPPPGNITFHPIETRGGLLLPNRDRGFGMGRGDPRFRVVLPLRPLWPGFIVNTLLYALTLWLLLAVPRAARRWI